MSVNSQTPFFMVPQAICVCGVYATVQPTHIGDAPTEIRLACGNHECVEFKIEYIVQMIPLERARSRYEVQR
jgi:hypothetical protein